MDQYLEGKEVEVDAISDGDTVCIPGSWSIWKEQGCIQDDSIAVYPPQTLSPEMENRISELTISIARSLNIKGY
jgi:carbamoyl-phosphate synthase large subunit